MSPPPMFGPKFKEWDVAEAMAPEDVTAQAHLGYEDEARAASEDVTVVDVKQHVRLRVFRKERVLRRLAFASALLLGLAAIPVAGYLAWRLFGHGIPIPDWVVVVACVAVGIGVAIAVKEFRPGR